MNRIFYIFLIIMLTSCQTIKEKTGMVKHQPDEYQVISNPPLYVPEDLVNVKSPEQLNNVIPNNDYKNLSKGESNILKKMSQ